VVTDPPIQESMVDPETLTEALEENTDEQSLSMTNHDVSRPFVLLFDIHGFY